MVNLPANYYHAFLGNGIDAVLIGYTGSMVADRINGPDRCYWYKADRYYPDDILVLPARDRWTTRAPDFRPSPGEPWHELAPLGRCWYEIGSTPMSSQQSFDPRRAVLTSSVQYPLGTVHVTTFLHATLPVLVERFEARDPMPMRLWCAAGVWSPEPEELHPFSSAQIFPGARPVIGYALGSNPVQVAMVVVPEPSHTGAEGYAAWVETEARQIVRYFMVIDGREERLRADDIVARISRQGYEDLWRSHLESWDAYYRDGATIEGDEVLNRVYTFTAYQLKASQDPHTGAIPVNNLRATWSSHVFWDAGFMHLAMLQMGHRQEARLGCQFFERLHPRAAGHARAYGAEGLKYDWELTHDGRGAYGVHGHLVHQVHNNAMFSLMCWHQYDYTRDMDVLAELYPIMQGIAAFFLTGVVRPGPTIKPVTGIAELAPPVVVDTTTLAGTIRALEIAAAAASILRRDDSFAHQCASTANGLRRLVTPLITDGTLRASDRGELSWGVLPACSLMGTLQSGDPIVLRTAREFVKANVNPVRGILGHGAGGRGPRDGYPWVAAWVAAILAAAGVPDEAWAVLQPVHAAVNHYGGVSEKVFDDGRWNMQYFTTAQAALCLALQALIAHRTGEIFRVGAPPWKREGTFTNLHLNGTSLSGSWAGSKVTAGSIRNATAVTLEPTVEINGTVRHLTLRPGETYSWP